MSHFVSLVLGERYPFKLPGTEGAIADFLRPSVNRLVVAMPDITEQEVRAMRQGEIRGGFLFKNSAILFLWQFVDPDTNAPVLTLDSPFDARFIKDIRLDDITGAEDRLLVEGHIVDTATNIIKGLRAVTMPPDMTVAFLSAVQEQLSSQQSGTEQMQAWMAYQPVDLIKQTKMWVMGG